jgi:hypothetical protein
MKKLTTACEYLQVISLRCKEGSSKSGLAGMKEVSGSKIKRILMLWYEVFNALEEFFISWSSHALVHTYRLQKDTRKGRGLGLYRSLRVLICMCVLAVIA